MRIVSHVLVFLAPVLLSGLAAGCSADQCSQVLSTPVVGEGLQILQKLIDGYTTQGVGNALLCTDGQRGGPTSEPDALGLQTCSECLEKSCTPQLDACEKDATCDGIAQGRLNISAANTVWQAAAACVPQCANPCAVSTSSNSSASSSSGAGQDAGP